MAARARPLLSGAHQARTDTMPFGCFRDDQDPDVAVRGQGEIVLVLLEEYEPAGRASGLGDQERFGWPRGTEVGPERPRLPVDDLRRAAARRHPERGETRRRGKHEAAIARVRGTAQHEMGWGRPQSTR